MAAEISAPLCKAKKITMVSSGKGDVGAAKLSGEVLTLMEKMPHVVENLTGINISKVGGARAELAQWSGHRSVNKTACSLWFISLIESGQGKHSGLSV